MNIAFRCASLLLNTRFSNIPLLVNFYLFFWPVSLSVCSRYSFTHSIHQSSLHPDYAELGFYFLLNLCFAILIEFVTFFYSLSLFLSYLSTQSFHSTLSFNDLFSYIFMDGFLFLQHLSSFFRRYRLICYRCWWQITFAFTPVLQIEVNTARWLQEARINVLPLST